ncbi:unnamed protein product [Clonostachys rhizophaga]|uniref:Major facilitator superfamily (MFS) profile domain-containing protein n=1 Tax=Clonostachys rhizophaga TaxID=160324 RepID=A0A9N9VVN6_9HYPO|nr:unnamed protein product [Clonostachys rhizophaga]
MTSVEKDKLADNNMSQPIVHQKDALHRYFFGIQGRTLRMHISVAGALGFLLFGYDQGVLGRRIGCFFGAITVFFLGSKLGRKRCIYIGAVLQLIGAVLQASAFGVPQMIVGRIVCGWGNGFNTATTPLWVSELVPAKNRGRHVAIEGNLIAFGIVIAYYFNIGMSYTSGAVQWRLVIAFQAVFIALQVFWTYLLPESPRWLSQQGRHDEAIDIITQISGKGLSHQDPIVVGMKSSIDEAITLEQADGRWRFSECFKSGPMKIRRRFLLAIGLQAMQQLSGINVLVFYAPHTMTTDIGWDYETALQISAGLGLTYWVFSFVGIAYIDKLGRRPPLIWSSVGCALCFLAAGLLQQEITPYRAKASLAFFFIFEAIFGIAWLPVPWLYAPEIMPLRHRAQSAALGAASDWIFNYLVVQITPVAISNIRWKTYMIFFVLNFAFAILVFLFYPETTGRSLEDIDSIFLGDNDRVFVVDGRGRLLPGFRKAIHTDSEIGIAQTYDSSEVEGKSAVQVINNQH